MNIDPFNNQIYNENNYLHGKSDNWVLNEIEEKN